MGWWGRCERSSGGGASAQEGEERALKRGECWRKGGRVLAQGRESAGARGRRARAQGKESEGARGKESEGA